jgi:hypothetical protein
MPCSGEGRLEPSWERDIDPKAWMYTVTWAVRQEVAILMPAREHASATYTFRKAGFAYMSVNVGYTMLNMGTLVH